MKERCADCCSQTMRFYAIKIVEWKWFDRIIIVIILINSVLLGLLDYVWEDDGL